MTDSGGLLVQGSRQVLHDNAKQIRYRTQTEHPGHLPLVDLRRGAWGLGIASVLPVVYEAGFRAVVCDPHDEDYVDNCGVEVIRRQPEVRFTSGSGALVPNSDVVAVPMDEVFGFIQLETDPVLTVSSEIVSTKLLRAGEGVSYTHRFVAKRDTQIALIRGGYGQGIPRALGGVGQVDLDGVLCPIVGRVAMDVCVIDLGDHTADYGQRVTLCGGSGPVRNALAGWAEAIGWQESEIICGIAQRSSVRWD